MDTRISDRIKSRSLRTRYNSDFNENGFENITTSKLSQSNFDRCTKTGLGENNSLNKVCLSSSSKTNVVNYKDYSSSKINVTNNKDYSDKYCDSTNCRFRKQEDIPDKPSVSLIQSGDNFDSVKKSSSKLDKNVAQFYDHSTRYLKQIEVGSDNIQKIPIENIKTCSCGNIENDILQNMYKRDKIAFERGQKALEKEKTHKYYNDLMKNLPVSQRQEKIASIKQSKQSHHMSNERLQEHNKKLEICRENAFENIEVFQKPHKITIPSKPSEKIDSDPTPFKIIDTKDTSSGLNIATWDINTNKTVTDSVNNEKLHQLLMKLKAQKDDLLKEVEELPNESNLIDILNNLETEETKTSKKKIKSKSDSTHPEKLGQTKPLKESKHKSNEKRTKLKEISNSGTNSSSSISKQRTSSRKKIILQNISTQTTPKVDENPTEKNVQLICPSKHPDMEKVCEILIKISDDKEPEILVSPNIDDPLLHIKSDVKQKKQTVKIQEVSDSEHAPNITTENSTKINDKKENESAKRNLWQDQFKSFDKNITSSSTSYYSPPNFVEEKRKEKTKITKRTTQRVQHNQNMCDHSKLSNSSKLSKLDPRLLIYIKKLLAMSRASIEDLTVSSVSEVTTPNSSIINTSSNNPLQQLHNVMKFFNINADDLNFLLKNSYSNGSSSRSTLFDNNLRDNSNYAYDASESNLKNISEENEISRNNLYSQNISNIQEDNNTTSSQINKIPTHNNTSLEKLNSNIEISSDHNNTPNIMKTYSEIEENCVKRIKDLNMMIENIRKETQTLESPYSTGSDKENSTAYINLPITLGGDNNSSANSTNSSFEQEKLTQKLVEIDIGLAEKLKAIRQNKMENSSNKDIPITDDIDKDLYERFKRLQQPYETTQPDNNEKFLLGIPKLDKLPLNESNATNKRSKNKFVNFKKKPYDDLIPQPHELSTILEGDTILSTRRSSSKSPIDDSKNAILKQVQQTSRSSSAKESNSQETGEESSVPDILSELSKGKKLVENKNVSPLSGTTSADKSQNISRSSDKSELESIEAMLHGMGMSWAVSTLRKTQKALEQTSSSSSLEMNVKKRIDKSDLSSSSDVSLHSIIQKQFITRLSSSSDSDILCLIKEFGEISAVYGSDASVDKNQRTSTPVHTTKSSEKSKNDSKQPLFLGESDISSVKAHDDQFVNLSTDKSDTTLKE